MSDSSAERNPVELLAEEFAERYRRGERPSLTEYTDQHPQWAGVIRELFPALVVMEHFKPAAGDATGAYDNDTAAGDGKKLDRLGDYRILREVGRGGMGIVYEAEQESLGRHVALKVLPFHALLDPQRLRRFEREAKAAARLHHTNIVPVYGVGEHDGLHYYVMQFIQGEGLDKVLVDLRQLRQQSACARANQAPGDKELTVSVARSLWTGHFADPQPVEGEPASVGRQTPGASVGQPQPDRDRGADVPHAPVTDSSVTDSLISTLSMSRSELTGAGWNYHRSVARIGVQVANALAYAHNQGILHRDIKPSNLLLDTRGTVWVTDFGLAKAEGTDELTSPGDIVGTLRYMAPERFQAKSDACSDVYGLGITLYEMLTLRPAFEDSDRARLIDRVTHEEPPRPRKLDARIPRDLETIVLKAIARDPAGRYSTPEAMAEDLQRFLADRPIRARRTGVAERTWRWCRRNRLAATLLTSVGVLLIFIAAGSLLSAVWLRQERDNTVLQLDRAERAEQTALEKLQGSSYLAEARAIRWSGRGGRRFDSLQTLAKAAAIRPSLELRNEAIACMPLVDLRVAKEWEGLPPGSRSLGFDADFERYVRGALDGSLSIRRVADDQEIFGLPGFGVQAVLIQFSPNGQFLAVKYHNDSSIHFCVWDLKRREAVVKLPNGVTHNAMDFSPDSRWAAAGQRDGSIRLFDLIAGKEGKGLARGPEPYMIRFHPDGRQLAISTLTTAAVQVRDLNSGEVVQTFSPPREAFDVAWHPDGKLLAAGCRDYRIYVWNTQTGRAHAVLVGHQGEPVRVAFNHKGDVLASAAWDSTGRLWDPLSGRQLLSFPGEGILQFNLDDSRLGYFLKGSRVRLYEVARGRECRVLREPVAPGKGPAWLDISPDGRLLVSCGDDGVRLWDQAAGQPIATPIHVRTNAGINSVFFHPAGDALFVSGMRGIERWPIKPLTKNGDLQIGPPERLRLPAGTAFGPACFSRDGRILAAVTQRSEQIVVVDLGKRTQQAVLAGQANRYAIAISPDGRWVATGPRWRGVIQVWDVHSQKLAQEWPAIKTAQLAFSPDGQRLLFSDGEACRSWKVGSWELDPVIAGKGSGAMALAPDGQMLAIASSPGTIGLTNSTTGEELGTLQAPLDEPITWLCFSSDGSQLAVACQTHVIQVWDLRLIRQQLGEMELDWNLPPYPPAAAVAEKKSLQAKVDRGKMPPPPQPKAVP